MKVISKVIIPFFLFAIILTSCNGLMPTPTISTTDVKETAISTSMTAVADTQAATTNQVIGKWSGEAGWVCDQPSWQATFEFSSDKVTASFTRADIVSPNKAEGVWSLTDNNIKIQFPDTIYFGTVSGNVMQGTMPYDGNCSGVWSLTKNE